MECNVLRKSILANETIYDGAGEQPIDVDLTLPDFCADIGRILKCRATPRITSRLLRGDGLTVEGVTQIVVLYSDSKGNEVSCYEHELPFAAVYKLSDVSDNAKAEVTAVTEYVNCRAISQRKLDIHGAFSLTVKITAPKETDIVSSISGAGVMVRCSSTQVSSLVAAAQSSFTVSDSAEVGSENASIGSVIRNDAEIRVTECRAIANKLVVKGTAELMLVYCGESGEGVQHMNYSFDFNEFIDVSGIDEECVWDIDAKCVGVDIGLRTDQNGEYRRMNVDIHCFANVRAYRNTEAQIVCDAYSVDYEIESERRQLKLERFCGNITDSISVDQVLDTGAVMFSRIDDVKCEVRDCVMLSKGGRAAVSGSVTVCLLGRDNEGKCAYAEKLLDFDCDTPLPCEVTAPRFEQRVKVNGCTYILNGAGKPEVRINLAICAALYDEISVSQITAVTADESRPKTDDGESLVMYYAQTGEELWDIARAHNSSVERIIIDNELESENISESRTLLISR